MISLFILLSCQSREDFRIITVPLKRADFAFNVRGLGELEAKRATSVQAPRIRRVRELQITSLVDEGTQVKKGDIVAVLSSTELETRYLNACDEYEIARAALIQRDSELKMEKASLEVEIRNAENQLKSSELQLKNMQFESPNIIQLEKLKLQKTRLDLESAQKKWNALEKIQKEDRIGMELQVEQAENDMKQTLEDLNQLSLKAPTDGIVIYEINWMTGEKQSVNSNTHPGWPIVKIPDLSQMQVKLYFQETDAQRIQPGQKSTIEVFSADTLQFTGKVTRKDRMAKPIKRDSNVKKVEVIVELDKTDILLTSGLTALCDISIEEFKDALVLPRECIFEKDSLKIIYSRETPKKYVPYGVRILNYTDNDVILDSFIDVPAQCTLSTPPHKYIQWPDKIRLPKAVKQAPSSQPPDSTDIPENFERFRGRRPPNGMHPREQNSDQHQQKDQRQ